MATCPCPSQERQGMWLQVKDEFKSVGAEQRFRIIPSGEISEYIMSHNILRHIRYYVTLYITSRYISRHIIYYVTLYITSRYMLRRILCYVTYVTSHYGTSRTIQNILRHKIYYVTCYVTYFFTAYCYVTYDTSHYMLRHIK